MTTQNDQLNYKYIFGRIFSLLVKPIQTWGKIRDSENASDTMMKIVYPMIGIISLLAFLKKIYLLGWGDAISYQQALVYCCAIAVAYFVSFFLISFLSNKIMTLLYKLPDDKLTHQQLVGNVLIIFGALYAIKMFFPWTGLIIWIVQLYLGYVIWGGLVQLLVLEKKDQIFPMFFILILCIYIPDQSVRLFLQILTSGAI